MKRTEDDKEWRLHLILKRLSSLIDDDTLHHMIDDYVNEPPMRTASGRLVQK